jgi:SAM-dependent methyltransferase
VSEWFEDWFGEVYLELYPHRDEAEAARAVALLQKHGVARGGSRVLDLACGAGRHAVALAAAGASVVGLDLSLPLLRSGQRKGVKAELVRGDIRRLPLRAGGFDAVVNLFTSFGYFATDDEHLAALLEVARVLRPGGRFALDFLNAPAVRATLVPSDEKTVGGRRIVQRRRLENEGRTVTKEIQLIDEGRNYMERVRLFERAELEAMLPTAGLRVDAAFGDYDGGPHTPASSRLILLATRS